MDEAGCEQLAAGWLAYHKAGRPAKNADEFFWAVERMADVLDDDPEAAWQVIDLIWRLDQSDPILAKLAAGPVEDLLANHGDAFIERLYLRARREPVFRKMLGAVWRNSISEPVWQRLKQIAGPSF